MMKISQIQKIHCPNCGCAAERRHFDGQQIIETACPICDYLMVSCSQTGKVFEFYAPGVILKSPARR